jgi:hypothetical protein
MKAWFDQSSFSLPLCYFYLLPRQPKVALAFDPG